MTTTRGQSAAQTLGTWLKSLRPGDPCPWCGASLRAAGMGAETDGTWDRLGSTIVTGRDLVCRECGCEISPVDGTAASVSRQLDHAA